MSSTRWIITLVAAWFLTGGTLGVVSSFTPSPGSLGSLMLGVLNLMVGVGLLFRRPPWRMAALAALALQLAGIVFAAAMILRADSPLTLELLGRAVQLDGGLDVLFLAVLAVIEIAAMAALSRPSVRAAFASHVEQAHPADRGAREVDSS